MNDDDHLKNLTKSRDTAQLTRNKSGYVGMVHISCWFCIASLLIKALRIIVVPLSLYWKHCSLNCNPLSCDTKVIVYNTSGLQSERRFNKVCLFSVWYCFLANQVAHQIRGPWSMRGYFWVLSIYSCYGGFSSESRFGIIFTLTKVTYLHCITLQIRIQNRRK